MIAAHKYADMDGAFLPDIAFFSYTLRSFPVPLLMTFQIYAQRRHRAPRTLKAVAVSLDHQPSRRDPIRAHLRLLATDQIIRGSGTISKVTIALEIVSKVARE